jgi:putative CocE/NonD family hydrolase
MTLTSGRTTKWNLLFQTDFWIAKYRDLYLNHIPFSQLQQVVGTQWRQFSAWMEHLPHDPFWDHYGLPAGVYQAIALPILTITAHYDSCQRGSLNYCRAHERLGSPERVAHHHVIIGPWDHAGTRTPQREFGGLCFGEASLLDLNQLHKEWYDWTMKNGPKPAFLQKRVAYYLMGAEAWKYADDLGSIADTTKRLYLNSTDGQANDVFHSGRLDGEPPGQSEPDRYIYDPLDTRPAELEQEEIKDYLTDQRYALNLFGNGLVYHSEPFEEDTEITGWAKLVVWIELDVPDTDFEVTLSEILPDGAHIKLSADYLRARYREGMHQEVPVTPGEVNRYEFGGFTFFSRLVSKGSRLRLVLKSPNSIHLQKNYNSGGVVETESGEDARTAHVTLYHDAEHPSYLELPVVTQV